ncbi:MAG: hypothetical protein Q7V88_15665 [Actinomycetota bacterium]|nr:hypothetical protein [Actinomycetota bacterium]
MIGGIAAAAMVLFAALWLRPRLVGVRSVGLLCQRRHRRHRRLSHRRPRPPDADLWAAVLDSMAAEARTGSSLTAALERALARHRPEGGAMHPGATTATIVTARVGDADEAVVVQAIATAHALGGPVAATLDAAAALLRERAAIRGEAAAHSAQARLSARVLTGVPVAFAAWSLLASASFRAALLSSVGLVSAAAGALCNLAGWWWMRRIVGRAAA